MYCIIILISACSMPVEEIETAQIAEIIETEGETETMERVIIMNPIPAALGYLFKSGILKGIIASTGRTDFMQINPAADIDGNFINIGLSDFFTKDGKKYFSFIDIYQKGEDPPVQKQYFYEQDGATVNEIAKLPEKPAAPIMLDGEYGLFTFEVYNWEGTNYNRLKREETLVSTAKGFDTACLTDNGLLFSQAEKLSREAGLWYMGNEQQGGPTRISDYQRIW